MKHARRSTSTLAKTISAAFAHPSIGIAGALASIVSVGLSLYFFWAGRQVPGLTYTLSPTRTVVFRAHQSSALRVTRSGEPLDRDVTAAQLIFWNSKRGPIHRSDVLEPLSVEIGDNARLLEVRVQKVSRPVTAVRCTELSSSSFEVNWRLLEMEDGGIIQFIYEGTIDAPIAVRATIEGQRRVIRAPPADSELNLSPKQLKISLVVGALLLLAAAAGMLIEIYYGIYYGGDLRGLFFFISWYLAMFGVFSLGYGLLSLLFGAQQPILGT